MVQSRQTGAAGRTYIYLPFVDEHATGMQRFGSEIITALLRTGIDAEILIGQLSGKPRWLQGLRYRVMISPALARRLPRTLLPAARILWLQIRLPLLARRGARLLALAHELAPFPLLPQIGVVHDLTQLKSYAQQHGSVERVRNALWTFGLRRSRSIIAISGATKHDLVETIGIPSEDVEVIYEGFDPAIFKPAAPRREPPQPFLLYAGTLAPNKNIPFLLQIFARLRRTPGLRLKLVGKQPPEAVQSLLSSVAPEVRQAINFEGFVTDEQLAELMRQCAAFVFPSLNEGFGLAVVEAMACGAPVISSDAGSLREVVSEGGLLLSPTDADRWIDAIEQVLADNALSEELRTRALERSAAFSWDGAAAAYLEQIGKQPVLSSKA